MSIESAPSSISTNFSPEVSVPSFSPTISNEAGFNFNPSAGGMVDLKIETYTQPFESNTIQTLDLPQDFSYSDFDLSPDSNIFDLPKFEFQAEKFVEEIDLPKDIGSDLELPTFHQLEDIEREVDTVAIEDVIAQIQTNPDLNHEEQAIWAPKFKKLLEEKTVEVLDEPADFAPVTRIDELASDLVDEYTQETSPAEEITKEASTIHNFEIVDFGHDSQEIESEIVDETEVKAIEIPDNDKVEQTLGIETAVLPHVNGEPQTVLAPQADPETGNEQSADTQAEPEIILDSGEDDLPPIDTQDRKTDEEDEPDEDEEEEEIEPEWEIWEINKTKQVAGDSLKRRLELSSKIIQQFSHDQSIPIKDMVEGQIYKLDIPNEQDVIENVDLPPVAHFAEVGLSKIGEDAEAAVVHKALTDAVTSALPTKITKIARPKGIVKESQLEHGAQALAAAGAKHIYHDAKRGYFAQESATHTPPWEADKEAA